MDPKEITGIPDLPANPEASYNPTRTALPIERNLGSSESVALDSSKAQLFESTVAASAFGIAAPIQIGRGYELGGVIGRGGMGEVLEAKQLAIGRTVAVKRLRDDRIRGAEADVNRHQLDFCREAMVAAWLEHPNIVPVHDLAMSPDGQLLMAMKMVKGETWDRLLRRDLSDLPYPDYLAKHLPIFIDLCQAAAFAHSRGVVHRDLKPSQVVVGEFGEVLLMDWGLAVFVGEQGRAPVAAFGFRDAEFARDGFEPGGTPALMAPEQTERSATRISTATDVFLLGGTLYFILTGTFPHRGETTAAVFLRAKECRIESPKARAPRYEVPAELEALCLAALKREPHDRIASAKALMAGVQDYLSGASKRRESVTLTMKAKADIEEVEHIRREGTTERLYMHFSGIEENLVRALVLWPENPEARVLRRVFLTMRVQEETRLGDLILARMHLHQLIHSGEQASTVEALVHRLDQAETQRTRIKSQRLAYRIGAYSAIVVAIALVFLAMRLMHESDLANQREREQAVVAEESERQRELFRRAMALAREEHELADRMAIVAPLPDALEFDPARNTSRATESETAELLARRERLRAERQRLASAQVPLVELPYELVLAEANLVLGRATSTSDTLAAYRLFESAAVANPGRPEPLIGQGVAAFRADDPTSAALLLERATSATLALRGPNHPEYGAVLALTGDALANAPETTEAYRTIYNRALQVLEPQLIELAQSIAYRWRQLGDGNRSVKLLVAVLPTAIDRYGAQSSQVADMNSLIGVGMLDLGRLADAEPYLRTAYQIYKPRNDQQSASSMNNLAGLYLNLGRHEEALVPLRESLEIKERLLPPNSPSTATTLNNIAGAYTQLGRYAEALPYYNRAIAIRELAFGPQHPAVASALYGRAVTHANAGRAREAWIDMKRCYAIRSEILGENHPLTAAALAQYVDLAKGFEEPGDSLALVNRAIETLRKRSGGATHHLASALRARLRLERDLGDVEGGLRTAKEIVDVLRATAPDHPSIPVVRSAVAMQLSKLGRQEEAWAILTDLAQQLEREGFNRAPDSYGEVPEAYLSAGVLRGLELESAGDATAARAHWETMDAMGAAMIPAIKAGSAYLTAGRAVALERLGRVEEATRIRPLRVQPDFDPRIEAALNRILLPPPGERAPAGS